MAQSRARARQVPHHVTGCCLTFAAAVILVTGLALLAQVRRQAGGRRLLGWAFLGNSLVFALIIEGWLGLAAWLGLVPIVAG